MNIRGLIKWWQKRYDAAESDDSKETRQLDEEMKRHYRKVFSGPRGQIVLADMASRAFVLESILVNEIGPVDPYLMAFHEGRRSAVVDLLQYLDEDLIQEIPYEEVDHG